MKKEIKNLTNPFSDDFLTTWQLWKDFRKEEHNFQYIGIISEQMALKRLVEVSEGDEEKATRIVEQSISRGWMDFYQLKQPKPNGKSSTKKTGEPKPEEPSLRDQAAKVFNMRNAGGGHPTNSGNSQAV